MNELWHAYAGVDGDEYFLAVVGPVSSDVVRADKQPWESSWLGDGPYTQEPLLVDFITSFDHEPTQEERLALVPAEFKNKYLARAAADSLVAQQSDFDEVVNEFHLDDDEETALSLAVASRVETLSLMYERMTIRGQSPRGTLACQEQIEALQSVWSKMGLKQAVWEY